MTRHDDEFIVLVLVKNNLTNVFSPGRSYASAALKQIFVHLLTMYNFKLVDPDANLIITYIIIVYLRLGLKILMQKR